MFTWAWVVWNISSSWFSKPLQEFLNVIFQVEKTKWSASRCCPCIERSLFLNSCHWLRFSDASAAVRTYAPTICTFSSWQSKSNLSWEPGILIRSLCFVKSSKLQITFSPFLMMTNYTPDFKTTSHTITIFIVPPELLVHTPEMKKTHKTRDQL